MMMSYPRLALDRLFGRVTGVSTALIRDGSATETRMLRSGTQCKTMVVVAMRNASIPPYSVLPVLAYDDVRAAVEYLTQVFGFAERVQIGDHRAQLSAGGGGGAVIVADATHGRRSPAAADGVTQSVMVRVDDVDAHYRAAVAAGAQVTSEPADYAYGERQYSVRDPAGHLWTFTQSVADIAPETWGGVTVSAW
jgi:uncharacterized glyoxalase superfamily protein PhnB